MTLLHHRGQTDTGRPWHLPQAWLTRPLLEAMGERQGGRERDGGRERERETHRMKRQREQNEIDGGRQRERER